MGGVLVVAETRRGELREVSLELIAAALAVKDAAGGRVAVAVIDHEPQRLRAGAVGRRASTRCCWSTPPGEHFEAHVAGARSRS